MVAWGVRVMGDDYRRVEYHGRPQEATGGPLEDRGQFPRTDFDPQIGNLVLYQYALGNNLSNAWIIFPEPLGRVL